MFAGKTMIIQHFKGGYYKLIGFGKHTETQEQMFIYQNAEGQIFVRPMTMFEDMKKNEKGEEVPRFKIIGSFDN
jgi:hypothetical protein